jgi:hypothetical protein
MDQPPSTAGKLQEWFGTPAAARRSAFWLLAACLVTAVLGVALYFLVHGLIEIGNP